MVTGFIDTGLLIDWNVKFNWELVDLLEVEGKFERVIDDEDVSFDWEKLLKPVELIVEFKKIDGNVKTIVSAYQKGLAIFNDILPLKIDWTKVLLIESNAEFWNCIGVKSVITELEISILELSYAWLEILINSEESTTGGVRIDWI